MSLAQRAVRGTIYVLFSSYANMGLGIVYGVLLARVLTPEHFGVFAGALFFATVFDVRGKLGLDYAFVHRQPTTPELLTTHWYLQAGLSALTVVILGLAALVIKQLNYPPATPSLMMALGGALLLEALGSTARVALEKELNFGRSTMVVSGALLLSYLSALAAAYAGFTYWALLTQLAVNAGVSTLGFWWIYTRRRTTPWTWRIDPPLTRWLLRFGATMTIASLATAILLQFDNFLVLTLAGSAAAGYYVQAYKVAQWPTGLVTHIVSRTSLPTYAKLQDDPPRLSKAFELSLWLILMVALPLALAIFVTAPDFLQLLYGPTWLPAATPLRFLIGYSVLRPLLDDTGALFTAIGQPGRITRVLVTQAVTLIVIAPPLTIAWGAVGTAIGVGIAFAIGIAVTYRFISRTLTLNIGRLFAPPAIALGATLLAYGLLAPYLNAIPIPWLWLRVLAKGGFAVAAFTAIAGALQYRELTARVRLISSLIFPTRVT
ncbi:MAG: oligosaccharide flippase family protein [Anaerolineales bacterium]|nr:oligosaccharide flippase family protein [Anaerolineales bacterium]